MNCTAASFLQRIFTVTGGERGIRHAAATRIIAVGGIVVAVNLSSEA